MKEHDIQVAICNYLSLKNVMFFAVPNGGMRNIRVAQKLKREGVKAGVADLVLLFDDGECVFVEVKNEKGRQQETQKLFQQRVHERGFKYLIWRGVDDAVEFLNLRSRFNLNTIKTSFI